MLKRVLKYLVYGIAWGWCWMVAVCLVVEFAGFSAMRDAIYSHYPQNVLASSLVGIGFGTSSIVYTFERLSLWQQLLIHFGAGMSIYFPVAFSFGWMQTESIGVLLSFIVMSVVIFFLIWAGFYFYHRAEAKKINAQLAALENERGDD